MRDPDMSNPALSNPDLSDPDTRDPDMSEGKPLVSFGMKGNFQIFFPDIFG
jgi:hypothetical protein